MTDDEIKLNMEAGKYMGYPVELFNGSVGYKTSDMILLYYDIQHHTCLTDFIEKAEIDIYYCADSDEWQCDNELTKDTVDYASEKPDRHTAIIDCINHLLSGDNHG